MCSTLSAIRMLEHLYTAMIFLTHIHSVCVRDAPECVGVPVNTKAGLSNMLRASKVTARENFSQLRSVQTVLAPAIWYGGPVEAPANMEMLELTLVLVAS